MHGAFTVGPRDRPNVGDVTATTRSPALDDAVLSCRHEVAPRPGQREAIVFCCPMFGVARYPFTPVFVTSLMTNS